MNTIIILISVNAVLYLMALYVDKITKRNSHTLMIGILVILILIEKNIAEHFFKDFHYFIKYEIILSLFLALVYIKIILRLQKRKNE